MATVYKIEIETVSAFANYNEKYVKEILEKFLEQYKDKVTGLGFENIEINVKCIA